MKTFFHGLTGLLRFLVILVAGGGLLAVALGAPGCPREDCWGWFVEQVAARRTLAAAVGGGLIILELLHLLTRPRTPRGPDTLTFTSKDGPVIKMKTAAIRDAIGRVADEFDTVQEMTTQVTRHRGQIDLDLVVRAVAGTPIPVLCNDLQSRAREVVTQQIGLFDLRQVRVHVQDLLPPGEPPRWAPPAADPAAVPAPSDLSDLSAASDAPDVAAETAVPDDEAPTRAGEDRP